MLASSLFFQSYSRTFILAVSFARNTVPSCTHLPPSTQYFNGTSEEALPDLTLPLLNGT